MALMVTSTQNVAGNISYAPNSLTHPDKHIQIHFINIQFYFDPGRPIT